MEYKRLILVAPYWKQSLSKDGSTLTIEANFDADKYCKTVVEPIPGSNPPQVTYSCLNVGCTGNCELTPETLPDGSIIFTCICQNGGLSALSVVGGKKKSVKAKRKKSR